MIKCKLAGVEGGCPKNKETCCHECDEFGKCSSACGEEDPSKCDDAIFEGSTELEVFQSKSAAIIKSISDIVTAKKALEDQEKTMKEKLQQAMEQYGVARSFCCYHDHALYPRFRNRKGKGCRQHGHMAFEE